MTQAICSVSDCHLPARSKGWCSKHYYRWYRRGDPEITLRPHLIIGTNAQRFWGKVNKTENCWLWVASLNKNGYGQFKLNRKMVSAHRLSYQWLIGQIPADLQLDHLCRVRNCVNPAHLEPVTILTNSLRGSRLPLTTLDKPIVFADTHLTKRIPTIAQIDQGQECAANVAESTKARHLD